MQPENRKDEWKIAKINAIIAGVYSVLCTVIIFASKTHGYDAMAAYAICIAIQVVLCLLAFLVFLFINTRKAGEFLLSAITILILGFSICTASMSMTGLKAFG